MACIALDATYAVDPQPSGVAVYSRRLIETLAGIESRHRFLLCYRLSRFGRRKEFLRPAKPARARRVITLSQYTALQLVHHLGTPLEKIKVIPGGVDLPPRLFSEAERARERERWVGKGNELILSVGVIQTRKNTLNAARAVASLPGNYRLVLAGGNGHGSDAIHDFIRREGLSSRVTTPGYVA